MSVPTCSATPTTFPCMAYTGLAASTLQPTILTLDGAATYKITMPPIFIYGSTTYRFVKWDDNSSTNPIRNFVMNQDFSVTVTYEVGGGEMATVTFYGNVSAQVTSGETVTLTVTKPDSTTEILTTTTLADKTYTTSKVYTVAGGYSVRMHVDPDASYSAIDVGPVSFNIGLQSRTGTLNVQVA